MPEAFKNHFNRNVILHLGEQIAHNCKTTPAGKHGAFDLAGFLQAATHQLDTLELKERSKQITDALWQFMPSEFSEANKVILASLAPASADETILFENTNKGPADNIESGIAGWIMMPVCDYVTMATLSEIDDLSSETEKERFNNGLALLKACTKRFSAEFAIRPFLRDFPEQTLKVLHKWTTDDNVHVRRLVSEGSRPLLPWGLRLTGFVEAPDKIVPLLALLRDDESEYVRRSVANSLNDIAKHHPDKVAELCSSWWLPENKKRCKLIKHACRTLLKNGHAGALALFGFLPAKLASIELSLDTTTVGMGDNLQLCLALSVDAKSTQNLLIDYVVHHQKANGKMSPKVFKWTSIEMACKGSRSLTKKHSFKPVTTRKYYLGEHKIEVLINGKVLAQQSFHLV